MLSRILAKLIWIFLVTVVTFADAIPGIAHVRAAT